MVVVVVVGRIVVFGVSSSISSSVGRKCEVGCSCGLGSISITVSTEDLIVVAMLVVEVEGLFWDVVAAVVFHAEVVVSPPPSSSVVVSVSSILSSCIRKNLLYAFSVRKGMIGWQGSNLKNSHHYQ